MLIFNPLSHVPLGEIFFLLTFYSPVSFAMQKLLSLIQSHLSIITLLCWTVGVIFRMLLPMTLSFSDFSDFLNYFQSFRFYIMTLIHLDLILVQCEKQGSSSISVLPGDIQF
jgi:hypothetical protein